MYCVECTRDSSLDLAPLLLFLNRSEWWAHIMAELSKADEIATVGRSLQEIAAEMLGKWWKELGACAVLKFRKAQTGAPILR